LSYQQFVEEDQNFLYLDSQKEREFVRQAVNETDQWLSQQITLFQQSNLYQPPIVTCSDFDIKYHELMNKCQPVVSKCESMMKDSVDDVKKEEPNKATVEDPQSNDNNEQISVSNDDIIAETINQLDQQPQQENND